MTNERTIKVIFAENLKRLRASRKVNAVDLADAIGVAQSSISAWENAQKMPRAGAIEKLCEYFNVNNSELLNDSYVAEHSAQYEVKNKLPLYGSIAAGALAAADTITDNNVEYISIPKPLLGKHAFNKKLFILKVNGDSMNKIMPNGSYVVCKPIQQEDLKDDDIVIFSHDGEYSMKRVRRDEEDRVMIFSPESYNRKFRDIEVSYDTENDLKIYAKVIWYSVVVD